MIAEKFCKKIDSISDGKFVKFTGVFKHLAIFSTLM